MAHGRHIKVFEKITTIGICHESLYGLGKQILLLEASEDEEHYFTNKLKLRQIGLYNLGEEYYYAYVWLEDARGRCYKKDS